MDLEFLKEMLKNLEKELSKETKDEYNRSLSFQDLLFDRWERAEKLGFGSNSSIYQDSLVIGNVSVGSESWIGPFTVLDGSAGLKIGKNCSISAGVQIYTHDTVHKRITDGKSKATLAATCIEDSCYIGPLSIITKGVKVGHHSVIGAHSLVMNDLEPYSVAIGIPAKRRAKVKFRHSGEVYFEWEKDSVSQRIVELTQRISKVEAMLEKLKSSKEFYLTYNKLIRRNFII